MTRVTGNILNVTTYNTGDFLASTVAAGAVELPLTFAFDFEESGGEAIMVETDQVVVYTGFDPETQVLYLDASTPLGASAEAGTKVEVLPYSLEKRCFVETDEGFEPINVRVPHNLQAVLQDGIRTKTTGYESVAIEIDGGEWVLKEIYGVPAKITTDALPQIPSELMSDGQPPISSPGVTVAPLGVGALQGQWSAAEQPDLHDPVIYDVYVSATTPVVADADHFLTSTAGTSQSFSRVNVGGTWVPISVSEPSYMAVWARDTDGLAPSLGGEGSGVPRKADLSELNVGQLNANTIETLTLWAANVNADFVFANNRIQIGNANGSHIVLDPSQGLILYGTDGTTPIVTLDMTAAQLSEFTGKINTNQLAVFESVEIHGLFSKIMSAAYLTIASSTISAPSSPPTLTQSTNTRVWPVPPAGFAETGLHWDGTDWRRLLYNSGTFEAKVQVINAAGTAVSAITLEAENQDRDARGLVWDGTNYYAIRRDNAAAGSANFYLKKYNSDGTPVPDTGGDPVLGFDSTIGVADGLAHPSYVARDSSGNIFVTDTDNNRVVKYSSSGVFQSAFGSTGTGNGQFDGPRGIAIDASNNIFVCDSGNHRVQKFNSSGTYQSQFGSSGTGNGQFSAPWGIAIDASNNMYVTEGDNHRVQKFNSSGTYTTKWGSQGTANGQFDEPSGIEVDNSGAIYVADTFNHRVQKFTNTGTYTTKFGSYGSGSSQFDAPRDVAIDGAGNIYIVDCFNDRVQKFSSSHVYQQTIGSGGSGDNQFNFPTGMGFDLSGNAYVVDQFNDRILKYVGAYPQLAEPVANEVSPTIRTYPALGYDGTDLLVGVVDNTSMDIDNITGGAGVAFYDKTTLAFTSEYYKVTGSISANSSTTYVGLGNFDYGGSRIVLGTTGTMRVYTYSGTALTADTTYPTWTLDGTARIIGWDGTNFYSGADTTVLRRYSTFLGASSSQRRFWSQYQWENGSAQGTTPSPKAPYLDLLDRRWLNITVPSPGAGTGYTRIFTGNGTSTPANSAMYGLAGVLSTAGTVQTAVVLGSGTNPKTVSDIPTGAAGVFEAEEGSFSVNGNSVGRWHEKAATPRFKGVLVATTHSVANDGANFQTVPITLLSLSSHASAGYWSWNEATDQLTIVKEGFWRLEGTASWSPATANERIMEITRVGGAGDRIAISRYNGGSSSGRITNIINQSEFLYAGEVLTMNVRQNSGAALTLNGGLPQWSTQWGAIYEGPAI